MSPHQNKAILLLLRQRLLLRLMETIKINPNHFLRKVKKIPQEKENENEVIKKVTLLVDLVIIIITIPIRTNLLYLKNEAGRLKNNKIKKLEKIRYQAVHQNLIVI